MTTYRSSKDSGIFDFLHKSSKDAAVTLLLKDVVYKKDANNILETLRFHRGGGFVNRNLSGEIIK